MTLQMSLDPHPFLQRMNHKELKEFRKQIQDDYKLVYEQLEQTINIMEEMKNERSQYKTLEFEKIFEEYRSHLYKLQCTKLNLENLLFKVSRILQKRNVTPDWAHEGF